MFGFHVDNIPNFSGSAIIWDAFWTPSEKKGPVRALYALAYALVALRLGIRIARKKFALDDAAAMLAFVMSIPVFVIFNLISSSNILAITSGSTNSGPWRYPEHIGPSTAWMTIIGHDLAVWASRLAIAYTIADAVPVGNAKKKRISKFVCLGFIALWSAVAISQVFVCGTPKVHDEAYNMRWAPMCPVPAAAPTEFSLFGDVLSTVWLIFWPIYALQNIRVGTTFQRFVSFTAILAPLSVLTMSIIRFIYLYPLQANTMPNVRKSQPFWHVQVPLSLMICNFLPLIVLFLDSRVHAARVLVVNISTPVGFPCDFNKFKEAKQIETVSDEGDYGDALNAKQRTESQV